MFNRLASVAVSIIVLLALAACGGGDDTSCPQQDGIFVGPPPAQCDQAVPAQRTRLPRTPTRGESK